MLNFCTVVHLGMRSWSLKRELDALGMCFVACWICSTLSWDMDGQPESSYL